MIRKIEDNIYRDAPEGEGAKLHTEFLERLEAAEFDDELGQRPLHDIVNEIRADLGLHGKDSLYTFPRRTPADAAILCARATAPGVAIPSAPPMQTRRPRPAMRDPVNLVAALLSHAPPIRGP